MKHVLLSKKRANDPYAEDHEGEKHQYLWGFQDEEFCSRGWMGLRRQTEQRIGKPVRRRREKVIYQPPKDEAR